MHKLATAALAVALGLAWSTLPAIGAGTTPKEDKTIKEKAVDAKDKVKEKTSEAWDKTKEKTTEAKDKVKEKVSGDKKPEEKAEATKDKGESKVKAKAREVKDKVASKMERGDTKNAQQALQAKGYNPGPIDGIHGPRTSAAVSDFQKAEGLKVTGEVDADTRAKLMASGPATTTAPAASPATTPASPANPSSVGSPSAAPAAPGKVEKK
jgi:peptidoglycan hydrolase-like protein with peptidoglycan-binding domain